jgi:hypothetical protein
LWRALAGFCFYFSWLFITGCNGSNSGQQAQATELDRSANSSSEVSSNPLSSTTSNVANSNNSLPNNIDGKKVLPESEWLMSIQGKELQCDVLSFSKDAVLAGVNLEGAVISFRNVLIDAKKPKQFIAYFYDRVKKKTVKFLPIELEQEYDYLEGHYDNLVSLFTDIGVEGTEFENSSPLDVDEHFEFTIPVQSFVGFFFNMDSTIPDFEVKPTVDYAIVSWGARRAADVDKNFHGRIRMSQAKAPFEPNQSRDDTLSLKGDKEIGTIDFGNCQPIKK